MKSALKPEGVKDREMLHAHAKFLPQPKGSQTNIEFKQLIAQNATGPVTEDSGGNSLPSFEQDMILGDKSFRHQLPEKTE